AARQKFLPPNIPLGTKFSAEPRTHRKSGSHTLSAKFPCMCPVHPHMSAGRDFFDSLEPCPVGQGFGYFVAFFPAKKPRRHGAGGRGRYAVIFSAAGRPGRRRPPV